jgi:hypothetical protein
MDWAQLLNGVAALVAIGGSNFAFIRLGQRTPISLVTHFVQVLLLVWYAVINLALAFDLWSPEVREIIPLFRWAFAPLLMTYAVRQFTVSRRVETVDAIA